MDKDKIIQNKSEPFNIEKELEDIRNKVDNWCWWDQTVWMIRHGIWEWIRDLKWRVPNWFHRANFGWGKADTWNLDYYLSDVLRGSLRHLKANKHGTPMIIETNSHDEKKWEEILDCMIGTFDTAHRILDSEVLYIPTYEAKWQELYDKYLKMHDEKPDVFPHPLTKEACIRYEQGFEYFKLYFLSLWD